MEELAAHDGESTTPRKAQHKLGKVINQVQLDKFMESLDSLPEEIVPPTVDDPFGGSESKDVAYGALKGQEHTVFSGRLQQTELGRFPRTSLSMLRDVPWELKSSWHQVAPDAIEAEMGGPLPQCTLRPVREIALR